MKQQKTVKEVRADIGFRYEYEDGSVEFFYATHSDGYCYKDYQAYDQGGVCYIREAMFDGADSIVLSKDELQNPPEDICNRRQFIDLCSTTVEDYKRAFDAYFGNEAEEECFIMYLADNLMAQAEWAGIDMYIAEWDLMEEYQEFIDNKQNS